jgi:hypothetical protein
MRKPLEPASSRRLRSNQTGTRIGAPVEVWMQVVVERDDNSDAAHGDDAVRAAAD